LFFIAAGLNHFVNPGFYIRMVPDWLPLHAPLVQISGFCEVAGGAGVLIPQIRRIAALGLLALLIAVFPANVQMAMHPELYRDIGTETAFAVRLPLQFLIVAWVWWTCLRSR
jgi:uncharacterized membrane protein